MKPRKYFFTVCHQNTVVWEGYATGVVQAFDLARATDIALTDVDLTCTSH